MEKYDDWIKKINQLLTNSIDKLDTSNSINLYSLLLLFEKVYISFNKRFDNFKKLNIGNELEVIDYQHQYDTGKRSLDILVGENKRDGFSTFLHITEADGKIDSLVTNGIQNNAFSKEFYYETIKLNDEIMCQYMNLFDKYSVLFQLYESLVYKVIKNNDQSVFINIMTNNDNILNGLIGFQIVALSKYSDKSNHRVIISLNYDDGFKIDFKNCSLKLDDEEVKASYNTFDRLLKSLYISKDYLFNDDIKEIKYERKK